MWITEDVPPKVLGNFSHGTIPNGIGVPMKQVENLVVNGEHTTHQYMKANQKCQKLMLHKNNM